MKDNLENELESITPNILIFCELKVRELVIKKQQPLTSENVYPECIKASYNYVTDTSSTVLTLFNSTLNDPKKSSKVREEKVNEGKE